MKILTVILAALTATATAVPDCYGKDYDLCVFGGTASGVIAAYSAACTCVRPCRFLNSLTVCASLVFAGIVCSICSETSGEKQYTLKGINICIREINIPFRV